MRKFALCVFVTYNQLTVLDVSKNTELWVTRFNVEGNFIASKNDIIGLDRLQRVFVRGELQNFELGPQRKPQINIR